MEPTVESIILHPAILIASGFECITSNHARFLNAHRRHFHAVLHDLNETVSITPKDFELGGILNPFDRFHEAEVAYRETAQGIPNFPYLTRREILKAFYNEDLTSIWTELMIELFHELSCFCVNHKRSRDYFTISTKIIHELYPYPIYQKISSLHLCGLGGKLFDAFAYVFHLFKSHEIKHAQPIITRNLI